jgi:hypothetical protein
MALHEMFALMSNIPENETDNFTAKKTSTGISCFVKKTEGVILK